MTQKHCEILIEVATDYIDEQSEPDSDRYVFAYTITITNNGNVPARLISRHWVITDANGHVEEVRGAGVIGQQPVLTPGQSFEYTSFCPLRTSFGTMHGTYRMVPVEGKAFDAEIAPFALSEPHAVN